MPLLNAVLQHLNSARVAAGIATLTLNPNLTLAAQQHANFMCEKQLLSHSGKGRSSFDQRIKATGYVFQAAAENVALGAMDAQTVVELWMISPPHRANILNAELKEVGIGIAPQEEGKGRALPRRYWSLSLARPLTLNS
ncbi:MAG: CAP domain-containing protein [Proteobacteria bacterium]|nr:CAP domain-containing protein [Pseudomonadota bacterium]